MLGKQLHLSDEKVLVKHVISVKNAENVSLKKPVHGTGPWTSSWREETQDSGWVEWCRWENFGSPNEQHWWLLIPDASARLYVIDSLYDLTALLRRFPLESAYASDFPSGHFTGIDFERMAQDYDGLHLTEKAAGKLHLSYPIDMNSWDCESSVWFRWVFTTVERIEVPEPVLVPDEGGTP